MHLLALALFVVCSGDRLDSELKTIYSEQEYSYLLSVRASVSTNRHRM